MNITAITIYNHLKSNYLTHIYAIKSNLVLLPVMGFKSFSNCKLVETTDGRMIAKITNNVLEIFTRHEETIKEVYEFVHELEVIILNNKIDVMLEEKPEVITKRVKI